MTQSQEEAVLLRLPANVEMSALAALKVELLAAGARGAAIDAGEVRHITSLALQLFAAAALSAAAAGQPPLRFTAVSEHCRDVASRLGLAEVLGIEASHA
jgi:anti-anti-sigma regulatory factor